MRFGPSGAKSKHIARRSLQFLAQGLAKSGKQNHSRPLPCALSLPGGKLYMQAETSDWLVQACCFPPASRPACATTNLSPAEQTKQTGVSLRDKGKHWHHQNRIMFVELAQLLRLWAHPREEWMVLVWKVDS